MFAIWESSTGDDGDVFARHTVVHPAFQESLPISSDICEQLFDAFLGSELFVEWLQCEDQWQLHIVGGPGAGKTTFAALVAKRLRESISMSEEQTAHLATIFIDDHRIENELAFLEDILDSIYNQVTPRGSTLDDATNMAYSEYRKCLHTGRRAAKRIEAVAKALRRRITDLAAGGDAVLIIDHLDQCSPALRELVEQHLSTLQDDGMKILVTSRLPKHEPKASIGAAPTASKRTYVLVARKNKAFASNGEFDLIAVITTSPLTQGSSGSTDIWKAPEYYNLILDGIPGDAMAEYLTWDLEREHGDLGFMTLEDPSEPPLSTFGLAFRDTMGGTKGSEWIRKIVRYVDGSILQAKLALDRIHSSPSPTAVDLVPKRIPRNVQAQFNTAIETIEQQSADRNSVALRAIAAVGQKGDAIQGLSLSRLANLLQERHRRPRTSTMPPRSPEDVLNSANGYLTLIAPRFRGQEYTIAACHRLFWMFVNDEYNEDLIMAYAQLPTSKIPKSFTFQSPLPRHLSTFQTSPPNSRRESSDSMRGQDMFSYGALVASPPPEELSLGIRVDKTSCEAFARGECQRGDRCNLNHHPNAPALQHTPAMNFNTYHLRDGTEVKTPYNSTQSAVVPAAPGTPKLRDTVGDSSASPFLPSRPPSPTQAARKTIERSPIGRSPEALPQQPSRPQAVDPCDIDVGGKVRRPDDDSDNENEQPRRRRRRSSSSDSESEEKMKD
ncbi:hypothetical protein OPT61_g4184 [Boeremia exigua]|uniref:Uncharacterized protein n=1 Tax=Boeremia exigua TaxID=749465 RepID=A0ACC2IF07_9PLEO|nr:hypothetical protein OPT61_g4184 [Boeremia exigua]